MYDKIHYKKKKKKKLDRGGDVKECLKIPFSGVDGEKLVKKH